MSRYHVICDRCGFKFWNGETRMEWTGKRVCHGPGTNDCWEPRHPQERVRAVLDKQSVPNPRPRPTDYFLSTNEVSGDDL